MKKVKLPFLLLFLSFYLWSNPVNGNIDKTKNHPSSFSSLDTLGPFTQLLAPNFLHTDFFPGEVTDFIDPISGISEYRAVPSFGDLDGDGDADLLLGTRFGQDLYYFENTGSASDPNFVRASDNENPFADLCDFANPGCSDPNLFDVDQDGDLDLISRAQRFETSGVINFIAYCENIGSASSPNFVYRGEGGNPFYDLDIGDLHRPALVDLDADGDWDIATGTDNNVKEIAYFVNEGSNQNPQFVEKLGSQNPFQDFEEDDARPNFMDMDNDGDLDLVTSVSVRSDVYDGTFLYMENVGDSQNPQFEFPDESEPIIVFMQLFAPTISLTDLDGDGDVDMAAGSSDGMVHYYENQGSAAEGSFVQQFNEDNPFYGGLTARRESDPILADMDNDGDLDLIAGMSSDLDGEVMRYFENIGSSAVPAFIYRFGADNPFPDFVPSPPVIGITKVTSGDLDADGDIDIVAGNSNRVLYFENIGDSTTPEFTFVDFDNDPFNGSFDINTNHNYPALGDLDNDGDLDLLTGGNSEFFYFKNVGTPNLPVFEEVTGIDSPVDGIIVDGGDDFFNSPELIDLDEDGDLDVVAGGGKDGNGRDSYYFIENVGTAEDASFIVREGALNPFADIIVNAGARNPALADLDDDGDLDILSGFDDGTFRFFVNEGIGGPTSVNNIQHRSPAVFVYPNPVNDRVTIEIHGEKTEQVQVKLIHSLGKMVAEEVSINLVENQLNRLTYPIHKAIPNGLYVLLIEGDDWLKASKINVQK